MAINFASPSTRAAASDLTISVSPLGLIELADEEFEVHGPRLNRYATSWAFYLGHHWAYRREVGEPQITANYVRALSDFTTNFTFNKGVHFQSAKPFQHIVPALLERIWDVDNNKEQLLWDIGNQGSVSGDAFVKVAYEPEFKDPSGSFHPGRVRILPLNASFCFPEWHPHDRERLIRFKLKYRFWGTAPEGTRQVFTYTEIITDDTISEFVNDEMINERVNPLGIIPIVHIPNLPVSGSPWGLSDVADITDLNRTFNELATDISDIINYHAAPVTIITGAKVSNLEKGPKKVWAGLPKDSKVWNLEGGTEALPHALEYLDRVKMWMHEMTGVPETALGQAQPISNTSGVALAIQFQPMMMKYSLKKIQYETGFKKVCALALKTLFIFEPDKVYYDPETDGIMQDGQLPYLDPQDPLVYQIDVEWPPPLPVDILIKLNEINAKIGLGLESREGALRDLGEEFPDEKLQELFEEQIEDALRNGAMEIITAQIRAAIIALTGLDADGQPVDTGDGSSSSGGGSGSVLRGGYGKGDEGVSSEASQQAQNERKPLAGLPGMADFSQINTEDLMNQMVTMASGTKLAQRRNPSNSNS